MKTTNFISKLKNSFFDKKQEVEVNEDHSTKEEYKETLLKLHFDLGMLLADVNLVAVKNSNKYVTPSFRKATFFLKFRVGVDLEETLLDIVKSSIYISEHLRKVKGIKDTEFDAYLSAYIADKSLELIDYPMKKFLDLLCEERQSLTLNTDGVFFCDREEYRFGKIHLHCNKEDRTDKEFSDYLYKLYNKEAFVVSEMGGCASTLTRQDTPDTCVYYRLDVENTHKVNTWIHELCHVYQHITSSPMWEPTKDRELIDWLFYKSLPILKYFINN